MNSNFYKHLNAYLTGTADIPLIIAYLHPIKDQIRYHPHIEIIKKSIFEEFITEKVYTVIYRKSFIDPQEFPNFMVCFEEVFETSVDQNSNLNMRIKEDAIITEHFQTIRDSVDSCFKALEQFTNSLLPILLNFNSYNNINFKELENDVKPEMLKGLLDKFLKEQTVISKIQPKVNMGLFELNLENLIETVQDAPSQWIYNMRELIPKVLFNRLKHLIQELNTHIKHLSIQVIDVESFISLKLSVEEISKIKETIESKNSEIIDILAIIKEDKEINIPDYDLKLIREKETSYVEFEKKLDSMLYFIETNLSKYKIELKDNIRRFDKEIKHLMDELNVDKLNVYNEDNYAAIFYIEDMSVPIRKSVDKKDFFRLQETQIEVEDKSNFENLDNLLYEYDLKSKLWYSVRDFQDKSELWKNYQVLTLDLNKMENSINSWIEIGRITLIDLESPVVPRGLLENTKYYEMILPILKTFKNENINHQKFIDLIKQVLNIEFNLDDPDFSLDKLMHLPDIYQKTEELNEIGKMADEEKRLITIYNKINDSFQIQKIPLMRYSRQVGDKQLAERFQIQESDLNAEYEFLEEKLMDLKKILLSPYSDIVADKVQILKGSFEKYQMFLNEFSLYQRLVMICENVVFFNVEFQKDMPNDYKKFNNENTMKNLSKVLKENSFLPKYVEFAHDKVINDIRKVNRFYEELLKAVEEFLDKKRKENPKFYFLNNEELLDIYSNTASIDVKRKYIPKMISGIRSVDLGNETDEVIKVYTNEDEFIQFKYTKGRGNLKEILDAIELEIAKKLKLQFKNFKRDFKNNKENKRPKDILMEIIMNRENLGQAIFNFLYSLCCEFIEKALSQDDVFDKIIDIKIDSRDRRKLYIKTLKDKDCSTLDRRILTSLVSVENFFNEVIKNLIREDVSSPGDFNWTKMLNIKIDSESCSIKIFNYINEYGYEYVGFQNNLYFNPQSDKIFLTIADSFSSKKPSCMYGFSDSGKKETLKGLSKFYGRALIIFKCSEQFDIKSFHKLIYGCQKSGNWLCLDNMELIAFESLSVIAHEIMMVYNYISDPKAEFISIVDKIPINRNTQIFCINNIERKESTISNSIKNYFRLIGWSQPDLSTIVSCSLKNFAVPKVKLYTKKIKFIMEYLNVKVSSLKYKPLGLKLFNLVLKHVSKDICLINEESTEGIIRHAFEKTFGPFLTKDEDDDLGVRYVNNF